MFITKFSIDPKNHLVFKDLTSVSDYHNYIESAFPAEKMVGVRKRHLWRLNKGNVLLVSEDKPDLRSLGKYAGKIQVKNYTQFLNKLKNNEICLFELTVNPYKDLKEQKLLNDAGLIKWLQIRGKYNGFRLGQAQVKFQNDFYVKSHHYTIHEACIVGALQISDVEKFRKLLTQGIGKNKAFGMGLMTVIPVNPRKR